MTRLRNAVTGVVVSVSDEKADRLGAAWSRVVSAEPVEVSGRSARVTAKSTRK